MREWKLAEVRYNLVRTRQYEVAVLPIGATEPHGLHTAYGTDNYEIESLADAHRSYVGRLRALRAAQRPPVGGSGGVFDTLPCIRCARASGKLEWLKAYPASPWHQASFAPTITRFVRPSLRGAR